MAGSYLPTGVDIPEYLHMRLEGLKLLAHHLDEPIVIFNHQMEIVYANPSAEKKTKDCPLLSSHATPPAGLSISEERLVCDSCHVSDLFHVSEQSQEVESSDSADSSFLVACPLPRAVPLQCREGLTHFALLMGTRGSESVVVLQQDQGLPELSEENGNSLQESATQEIIGESEPIQRLVEMIHLVAASEATVLIQGESGTGKELVAKTIHRLSRRRPNPFVVVECSSLPESLLESELFGHVRGAFTGAVEDRKGLFEEAEGGTIFLDEIADTTPAFQARLLRVLQEGEIKPVGSNRSITVNVRVLSAANTSLEDLVKAKKFRADLYYRLAVLPMWLPSLRERQDDIPLLMNYFLDFASRRHGRSSLTVHPDAVRSLLQYSWPGNVRELENIIERAVVTCRHTILQTTDFFDSKDVSTSNKDLNSVSQAARRIVECDRIFEALSEAKGDKTRAARLLKISRSSLYNKLRTYQIS